MENKGFLGSLFDLSFTEFITPRIVKTLFILFIVISGFASLVFLLKAIGQGGGAALLAIIFVPLVFCLNVLIIRIWLEVIMVLFRIVEHTGRLVERGEETAPAK